MKFLETGETLATASAKAGMDQKTARKWRQSSQLPSEPKEPRSYRARFTYYSTSFSFPEAFFTLYRCEPWPRAVRQRISPPPQFDSQAPVPYYKNSIT